MTLAFAVDILIVVLLAGTIGLCVLLHFRLKAFREGQAEMLRLMEGFGEATQRAELGIQQLKAAGDEVGQRLNENIRKARGLADELAFLIERADRAADKTSTDEAPARLLRPAKSPPPRQANEDEPARTGASPLPNGVAPQARSSGGSGNASGRVAAHAAYARGLVERRESGGPVDTDQRDETGARSQVERELLEMLRQAR